MSDTTTTIASSLSLDTITASLISVEKLVTASAYIIGISFAIKALYSLKTLGESRTQQSTHGSIKEPALYLFAAGVLIYFPTGFEVFMNSTFGYSQVLAYAPITGESSVLNSLFDGTSTFGQALTLFVQVLGVIAFVRGWVLITRSSSQGHPPGGTGQGLTHVFGGILAMNIIGTLQVINNTLFGT